MAHVLALVGACTNTELSVSLDVKRREQNVYPNWTHIAHKLMPAEGTVWSQGPSSRWPDDLKTSFTAIPLQLYLAKSGSHIQITKRLSCFATDSVLLKAEVSSSLALCMFAVIRFMCENFSGHVRCPWIVLGSVMKRMVPTAAEENKLSITQSKTCGVLGLDLHRNGTETFILQRQNASP